MDQIQTKLDENVNPLSTVVFTVNISTFGYCIVRKTVALCLQCMVRLKFGAGFVTHWASKNTTFSSKHYVDIHRGIQSLTS